jgi:hypothetical protein
MHSVTSVFCTGQLKLGILLRERAGRGEFKMSQGKIRIGPRFSPGDSLFTAEYFDKYTLKGYVAEILSDTVTYKGGNSAQTFRPDQPKSLAAGEKFGPTHILLINANITAFYTLTLEILKTETQNYG